MIRSKVERILWAGAFALVLAYFFLPTLLNTAFQWDFRTYYHAAKVFAAGGDPYQVQAISKAAGAVIALPFVYPPTALYFFLPFTLWPFALAAKFYWAFKMLALLILIGLWDRKFLEGKGGIALAFFSVFAFNAAVFADFRAGNPGLFEQLLLWVGFWFYLRERLGLFCAAVVLCAFVKLQPILFLFLVLFSSNKNKWVYFVASCAVYAGINGLLGALRPDLYGSFLSTLTGSNVPIVLFERGRINPSMFAFLEDLFRIASLFGCSFHASVRAVIHAWIAGAVILAAGFTARRMSKNGDESKKRLLLYLVCVSYSLLVPRFKDYTYVLLILPAFEALLRLAGRSGSGRWFWLFFVLTATSPSLSADLYLGIFWEYYPLILAWSLWFFYLNEIRRYPTHV